MEHQIVAWILSMALGLILMLACSKPIWDGRKRRGEWPWNVPLDDEGLSLPRAWPQPQAPPTPKQKRQAWREWVETDGTQEGLLAYLEMWRDVPSERSKEVRLGKWFGLDLEDGSQPILRAGMDVASNPLNEITAYLLPGEKFDYGLHEREQQAFLRGDWRKTREAIAAEAAAAKFMAGQWVRGKRSDPVLADDLLRLVVETNRGFWRMETAAGHCVTASLDSVEPALPRKGEWWRVKRPCGPASSELNANLLELTMKGICITDFFCKGCVWEPVNFGRGGEAKG